MSIERASAAYTSGTATSGDAWAAEAAQAGKQGSQRIVRAGWIQADADIAEPLGVEVGADIAVRERLILLDSRPVEIAISYFPAAIAEGTALPKPQKIPGGSAALLQRAGHIATTNHETVSARMPTEAERRTLELADGKPVLILRRTSADANGRPIEHAVMVMDAAVRELHYDSRSA